ncbi:hypothetical protein [Paraburkholderia tropica]|uniref:hypothetical protein n=1 Tax=Paraburkholderia tropica TaxID=92647 RepID=UPI002AAF44CD|nr:hypothetical protein [Paraburkholderia tropica]
MLTKALTLLDNLMCGSASFDRSESWREGGSKLAISWQQAGGKQASSRKYRHQNDNSRVFKTHNQM